ncbi:MAG: hypothetical protein IKQ91_08125 [Oscillospiraceae bacterium]|nr:hypothetical protein [Oscillospiraceae bacterium]
MKKHILNTAAALAAAVLLTGCNFGADVNNSTYIDINGSYNNAADFRNDPDAALNAVIAATDPEPAESIALDDGSFTIRKHLNATDEAAWSGTFTLENGRLNFQYESVMSGGKGTQDFSGQISALNETGAYPYAASVLPQLYRTDSARTLSAKLPYFLLRVDNSPAVLEAHSDFLCVPVYGFKIEGAYKKGSDFTATYEPEKTLRDDRFSEAYYNEADRSFADQPDENWINERLNILANRYGVEKGGNMQFQLTFSGEKWEMAGSDGNVIGKGGYKESAKHSGLIVMYAEPDDPNDSRMLEDIRPLFLCIDENNAVYYPAFIKK